MTRLDMPIDAEPVCNWLDCAAGMGVAGCGFCFLGGNPMEKNCPKFIPDPEDADIEKAVEEWEKVHGKGEVSNE